MMLAVFFVSALAACGKGASSARDDKLLATDVHISDRADEAIIVCKADIQGAISGP